MFGILHCKESLVEFLSNFCLKRILSFLEKVKRRNKMFMQQSSLQQCNVVNVTRYQDETSPGPDQQTMDCGGRGTWKHI